MVKVTIEIDKKMIDSLQDYIAPDLFPDFNELFKYLFTKTTIKQFLPPIPKVFKVNDEILIKTEQGAKYFRVTKVKEIKHTVHGIPYKAKYDIEEIEE